MCITKWKETQQTRGNEPGRTNKSRVSDQMTQGFSVLF